MFIADAKPIADQVIQMLKNHSERIEIAGSLRRQCREVHDIELVILPKWGSDLLGNLDFSINPVVELLRAWPRPINFIKQGNWYTQIATPELEGLGSINIDLFFTERKNWGWQFLIRTGSAEFSKACAWRNNELGYKLVHGWPHNMATGEPYPHPLPEEKDVFEFLGMDWVAPRDRWSKSNIRFKTPVRKAMSR